METSDYYNLNRPTTMRDNHPKVILAKNLEANTTYQEFVKELANYGQAPESASALVNQVFAGISVNDMLGFRPSRIGGPGTPVHGLDVESGLKCCLYILGITVHMCRQKANIGKTFTIEGHTFKVIDVLSSWHTYSLYGGRMAYSETQSPLLGNGFIIQTVGLTSPKSYVVAIMGLHRNNLNYDTFIKDGQIKLNNAPVIVLSSGLYNKNREIKLGTWGGSQSTPKIFITLGQFTPEYAGKLIVEKYLDHKYQEHFQMLEKRFSIINNGLDLLLEDLDSTTDIPWSADEEEIEYEDFIVPFYDEFEAAGYEFGGNFGGLLLEYDNLGAECESATLVGGYYEPEYRYSDWYVDEWTYELDVDDLDKTLINIYFPKEILGVDKWDYPFSEEMRDRLLKDFDAIKCYEFLLNYYKGHAQEDAQENSEPPEDDGWWED